MPDWEENGNVTLKGITKVNVTSKPLKSYSFMGIRGGKVSLARQDGIAVGKDLYY